MRAVLTEYYRLLEGAFLVPLGVQFLQGRGC